MFAGRAVMAVSCSQTQQQGAVAFPKGLLQNSGGLWTKNFIVPPNLHNLSSTSTQVGLHVRVRQCCISVYHFDRKQSCSSDIKLYSGSLLYACVVACCYPGHHELFQIHVPFFEKFL